MLTEPHRRRWWQRKRIWAAAFAWLVIAYPFGCGPAAYAAHRQWLPGPIYNCAYGVLRPLYSYPTGQRLWRRSGLNLWQLWWAAKADRRFAPIYEDLRQHPERSSPPYFVR